MRNCRFPLQFFNWTLWWVAEKVVLPAYSHPDYWMVTIAKLRQWRPLEWGNESFMVMRLLFINFPPPFFDIFYIQSKEKNIYIYEGVPNKTKLFLKSYILKFFTKPLEQILFGKHTVDWSLVSSVLWRIQVSSSVMNRRPKLLHFNSSKNSFKIITLVFIVSCETSRHPSYGKLFQIQMSC